jgi:hypothetical protein
MLLMAIHNIAAQQRKKGPSRAVSAAQAPVFVW